MLHQIGVGALGPVFRTYEPSRDRLVAVKVFRLDITPEQAQTLAEELTRAAEAGLFHPSIVEPVAAGVQGTVAYRAEEYVPAESLDVAMGHYAPAPPTRVLPFITQLAGAIDFARAAGIGHGALHPRDIFVTPEEARATGFGVVDALERVGLRAPVRRPYSPPERIAGGPWGTPADVFSLAAIAFELITGRRPSGTGNWIGATGGAGRLHAVIARAMDDDPSTRYQTARAFAEALEAAARDENVSSEAGSEPPAEAASATTGGVVMSPAPDTTDTSATAPVPAAVTRDVPTQERPVVDDITAEREEDEAHWDLARQERDSSEVEGGQATELFADEPVEPASDRLVLDAADLALHESPTEEPRFLNESAQDAGASAGRPAGHGREESETSQDASAMAGRSFIPPMVRPKGSGSSPGHESRSTFEIYDRPLPGEQSGESRIVIERTRTAMFPIAVSLIVGLPLAFAAGYIVGARDAAGVPPVPADAAGAGATRTPASRSTPGETASAGKEWSEQTVPQPSAQPAAPAAAPPDVPAEAPTAAPKQGETAPPAPTPPRTGRIVVRSTPPRASVTLNGEWRGRTPLTLDDLEFGPYVVRVVAEGYRVAREEVRLSPTSASRTLSMQLERTPAATRPPPRATPPPTRPEREPTGYYGIVFVDSRPQGAKVYIAGKEYGKTPLRIPEVPIGSHVVRLELPDHHAWTKPIRVAAGQEVRVTGSLEPIR